MKKYFLVTSSLFKNGEIRVKSTFVDVSNFVTTIKDFGYDTDFEVDINQDN